MRRTHPPAAKFRRILVWMRRSLRVADNGTLSHALQEGDDVFPFVCASDGLEDDSPRGRFMRSAASDLEKSLRGGGSALFMIRGDASQQIPRAASAIHADALFVPASPDPGAIRDDAKLARALRQIGCAFVAVDDSVIMPKDQLLNKAGTPYTVFTPYKNAWLSSVEFPPPPFPLAVLPAIAEVPPGTFSPLPPCAPGGEHGGESPALARLKEFIRAGIAGYGTSRDIPAIDGTSRLSSHIAHGTISVRTVFAAAVRARDSSRIPRERKGALTFIGELIWREFYHQILGHFPFVAGGPFRREFARISWSRKKNAFDLWCAGMTGYPFVDAGMRQLNAEGWMHNRVRMVAASFLTKDLHVDWRRGESYFYDRLVDADVASNNGGWQWSAGTGTDAAPYFRVFNPVSQGRRFDPDGEYVRRYVPELSNVPSPFIHAPWEMGAALAKERSFRIGRDYPRPIVDHGAERAVALGLYASARNKGR